MERESWPPLAERIEAAINRVKSGDTTMRVPCDWSDPDVVLADCRREIGRLGAELEEVAEAEIDRLLSYSPEQMAEYANRYHGPRGAALEAANGRLIVEKALVTAENKRLHVALRGMVDALGMNVDGLPFEDGEVPALDAARNLIQAEA